MTSAERIPPQHLDEEKTILGSALVVRECREIALRELEPNDFYSTAHRAVFKAIDKYPSINGNVVDLPRLAEIIGKPEAAVLLAELSECLTVAENMPYRIRKLKDAAARRAAIEAHHKEINRAYDLDTPFIEYYTSNYKDEIFIPTWDNQPVDKKALVELSNVKILSHGNISMITAPAGAGKSSLLEAGCASVITPMIDSLGIVFTADTILYIDTERSTFDHHTSWQRYLRRAGIEHGSNLPATLRFENIRGIDSLGDRLKYLSTRIDIDDVPELAIIDGIGDFVADPNDSVECTSLISRLCSIAHRRNIGMLVTLHNNPSMNSTKARGVLGSELWRKCESVLIIEKLPDKVRRVTTDYALGKNRSASDTVSSCFRWDDTLKMHVSCAAPAEKSGKTSIKLDAIIDQMSSSQNWSFTDLRAMVMQTTGKTARTAESRIKDLCASQRIVKHDGIYSINQKNIEQPEYIHD